MKQEQNVPDLRFPGFEGEWERKRLGEECDVLMCKRIFAEQTSELEEIPFFKIGTLGNLPDTFISRTLFEEYKKKYNYPKKGEILLTCSGTVGKCVVFDGNDAYYQDSNIIWIDNPKLSIQNEFLYYILMNVNWGKLNSTTITRIYGSDLRGLEIIYPKSSTEQQKIATFFTAIDQKLQALQQKKALLEQYKKGVMQQLFSQQLRFKDAQGRAFGDWEVRKLGEVAYKVDKKNKKNELLPIYSISNVNGFVPQSEQFEGLDSNERGYDISLYKIVEKETFAYNPARINVGSIGYSGSLNKVIISSLYVCFKTTELINDYFFNYYLQTEHFKNSVLRNGEGGVRIYLFYENFAEISIQLPPLKEQIRIADFLTALDAKITALQSQSEQLALWKKGLLQQMFC